MWRFFHVFERKNLSQIDEAKRRHIVFYCFCCLRFLMWRSQKLNIMYQCSSSFCKHKLWDCINFEMELFCRKIWGHLKDTLWDMFGWKVRLHPPQNKMAWSQRLLHPAQKPGMSLSRGGGYATREGWHTGWWTIYTRFERKGNGWKPDLREGAFPFTLLWCLGSILILWGVILSGNFSLASSIWKKNLNKMIAQQQWFPGFIKKIFSFPFYKAITSKSLILSSPSCPWLESTTTECVVSYPEIAAKGDVRIAWQRDILLMDIDWQFKFHSLFFWNKTTHKQQLLPISPKCLLAFMTRPQLSLTSGNKTGPVLSLQMVFTTTCKGNLLLMVQESGVHRLIW